MPGRDGTGPIGKGALSGRGLGRGFGRCFTDETVALSDKNFLIMQKELLQKRLDVVTKQLENMSESTK